MIEFAMCILVFAVLCMEFLVYGIAAGKILNLDLRIYEIEITGFFVYFGIFQLAALPLILWKQPFQLLFYLWIAICLVCNGYVLLKARSELWNALCQIHTRIRQQNRLLLCTAVLFILFTCCYHGVQQYIGWDTSYYIGTVNTTLYTNTMYIYNGNSGAAEAYLDLRYALSSFYMHSAVLCRLWHISALMMQKYVAGSICICMHGLLVFAIGKKLFPGKDKTALLFLILETALNYGFYTSYTTSSFLLIRGYEAKGYCANVIIPALFYMALCFQKTAKNRTCWIMLFLIGFASVPISMSSILIVPVMMVVILVTEWLIKKDRRLLCYGIICVIPNGIYLVVYFLYTIGFRIST